MPFTIAVAVPWGLCLGARDKFAVISRSAALDVEDARTAALEIYSERRGTDADDAEAGIGPDDPIRGRWLDCMDRIEALDDGVATIIHLPDGATIAIEPASEYALLSALRSVTHCPTCGIQRLHVNGQHLIDTYNAAQKERFANGET